MTATLQESRPGTQLQNHGPDILACRSWLSLAAAGVCDPEGVAAELTPSSLAEAGHSRGLTIPAGSSALRRFSGIPQGCEKRGARLLQLRLQLLRAIAVAARPWLRAILVAAVTAGMSIFHAQQVEVLLPIRPLLLQRCAAKTHFHPLRRVIAGQPGLLHVTDVFVACYRSLAQRAKVDRAQQPPGVAGL